MEFAGLAATQSSTLHSIHIERSGTSAEVGEKFMQLLADHQIHWLEKLTLADEEAWFKGGREGCFESMIILLARQENLKLLNLHGYHPYERDQRYCLTEEQ